MERTTVDYYLASMTNIQEQLTRGIQADFLDAGALDFGRTRIFRLQYFRDSRPFYRSYHSAGFVADFETRYGLDTCKDVTL